MDNDDRWPAHLPVGAVRFARPTAHYDQCLAFYRDDLALPVLAAWRGHDGYDGVVFGLPGTPVHFELTQHGQPPSIPEPSAENQLVLYLTGPEAVATVVERFAERGHRPVDVENPYWARRGAISFVDPDGWIVVLAPWVFGRDDGFGVASSHPTYKSAAQVGD
ncbi:MAG TPA: VOC family protein [Actinospica sp.]|jgi:catechol 2,3-dioxygenase-like lactoylglutathione lyase family enzyme|nr:VOC family protein [Actinospica sp.]